MTLQDSSTEAPARGQRWRVDLVLGLIVVMALLVLGIAAKQPSVTAADVALDEGMAAGRVAPLTSLAQLLTTMAQPAVGAVAAVLVPSVLFLLGRRLMAVRMLGLFGVALAGASVVKVLIGEPRPPAALAAVAADTGHSFPSGHVTVAATVCAAVWVLTRRSDLAWRIIVGAVAAAFAVGVGWSRLYLGVHYLPDVVGSYLVVASAVLLVSAFLGVPAVRGLLGRRRLAASR